jgi:hypothetical protein
VPDDERAKVVQVTYQGADVGKVPVDPTIARSIDAGLLAARLPGELVRTLAPLVASELKRS